MSTEPTRVRVLECIRRRLGPRVGAIVNGQPELTDETHLARDLDVDSLDRADIAMEVEDEFQIEITDDEVAAIETVGDLIRCVEQYCSYGKAV